MGYSYKDGWRGNPEIADYVKEKKGNESIVCSILNFSMPKSLLKEGYKFTISGAETPGMGNRSAFDLYLIQDDTEARSSSQFPSVRVEVDLIPTLRPDSPSTSVG